MISIVDERCWLAMLVENCSHVCGYVLWFIFVEIIQDFIFQSMFVTTLKYSDCSKRIEKVSKTSEVTRTFQNIRKVLFVNMFVTTFKYFDYPRGIEQ